MITPLLNRIWRDAKCVPPLFSRIKMRPLEKQDSIELAIFEQSCHYDLNIRCTSRSSELSSLPVIEFQKLYYSFLKKHFSTKDLTTYNIEMSYIPEAKSTLLSVTSLKNLDSFTNSVHRIIQCYLNAMPFCCGLLTIGNFYSTVDAQKNKFSEAHLETMSMFINSLFDALWWLNYQSVIATHVKGSKWVPLLTRHMQEINKGVSPRTNNTIITYKKDLLKPSFKV